MRWLDEKALFVSEHEEELSRILTCLQIGQFFAARAEFVPEPICKKLSLLHDQVGLNRSTPTHILQSTIMYRTWVVSANREFAHPDLELNFCLIASLHLPALGHPPSPSSTSLLWGLP